MWVMFMMVFKPLKCNAEACPDGVRYFCFLLNIDVKTSTRADGVQNTFSKRYGEMLSRYAFFIVYCVFKTVLRSQKLVQFSTRTSSQVGDTRLKTNCRPHFINKQCLQADLTYSCQSRFRHLGVQ